jgi:hypothetical protein
MARLGCGRGGLSSFAMMLAGQARIYQLKEREEEHALVGYA